MGLIKREAHKQSNLWDIVQLPSGSAAQVLNNGGRPLFQVGFEISGVQLTQSDAELTGIYQNLVALINALPAGTRMRLVHRVDSNLKETLDQFDQALAVCQERPYAKFFLQENKTHLMQLLARRRVIRRRLEVYFTFNPNSLAAGERNFITKIALMGADFFYTALGGASAFEQATREEFDRSLKAVDEFRGLCLRMLRGSGMQAASLGARDLWTIGYQRNHPNSSKTRKVPAFPEDWKSDDRPKAEKRDLPLFPTPRETIFSQEPRFATDHVCIDGKYVGAVTLRNKPKTGTFPLLMAELVQFAFECEVVVDIVMGNQGTEKGKLALLENTATANVNTSKTVANVEEVEKLAEIQEARVRVTRGKERVVQVGVAVLPRGDSEAELAENCQAIENVFTNMNEAAGLRERNLAWQYYLQSAPESAAAISRTSTHSSSRAALMLPLNAPKKGDKRPLLTFGTPSGDLYKFDPFDGSNPNFNMGIFAQSGHGKSVMVFMLLVGALIEEALVTILDVGVVEGGGTYKPLCDLVGGSYVQFGSGATAINPLELPIDLILDEFDETDFGDPSDQFAPPTAAQIYTRVREYNKALLYVMITGARDSDQEQIIVGKLNQALSEFYADPVMRDRIRAAHKGGMGSAAWRRYPTLDDFVGFIPHRGGDDKVAELMTLVLRGTYCSGLEGAIFNRPSNIDQNSQVLVFDLKDVPQSMFEAVVVATNGAAVRRSYRRDGKLKFVVADEAGVLLKRKVVADLVAELFATGRKSGISTAFVAQDYAQAMRSEAWSDLKANMNNVFFGACYPQTLETVEQQMQMPREIVQGLASPSFKRNRMAGYSPWLHVKGGNEYEVVHCVPSIPLLWMAANDPKETAVKKRYLQSVGDPFLALRLLAADYPQLAEGGKQNEYLETYLSKYKEAIGVA
ncbi:VirB4 family type IV secretion system protein [Gloeobacter morelensis]|uniref:VirB4 family type IV secretion system protein n=1 Tax=Gloeobacter morelensis TaxID=2907343 RepID=UPI001E2CDC87|nr:hypothetical protein [Gloeobacter morelensis]UFP97228.1 hypothetical protein ISF26_24205 [Gloeobacter morelensis MG652769]